ncbi:MAG: SIMPL domain-containing protein [Chloroflexi bacterium]|nr:SIMPL domain-containing protein [Chloroflexota bacterium]
MRSLRFVLPVLTVFAVAGGLSVGAASAQENPTGIRVRGQGVVTAVPDIAFLTLGASVRAETAGAAFDRTEQRVAALTDLLKSSGVAERDIQTRQFNLNPEFGRGADNNPPPIIGWRATHTISVKLRDFAAIGRTIDSAVRLLENDALVQGISFAVEDTDTLAARARAQAIADARAKAQDMAARAGVTLGRVVYIQEISSPPPSPVRNADAARAPAAAPTGGQASFAAEISPGELTINVIVDVIFAIG